MFPFGWNKEQISQLLVLNKVIKYVAHFFQRRKSVKTNVLAKFQLVIMFCLPTGNSLCSFTWTQLFLLFFHLPWKYLQCTAAAYSWTRAFFNSTSMYMKMALYALRLTQNEGALNLINIVKTFWKPQNKGFTKCKLLPWFLQSIYLDLIRFPSHIHTYNLFLLC